MEGRLSCCYRLVLLAGIVQLLASTAGALNIDTLEPIRRLLPDQQSGALFGYSLVLHQTGAVTAGDRNDALQNTR